MDTNVSNEPLASLFEIKVEKLWPYSSTHEVAPHAQYWKSSRDILKPSPAQAAAIQATLAKSCHDIADLVTIKDAHACVPYVEKMFQVRNKLGLWSHWQTGVDEETWLRDNNHTRFFAHEASMFRPEQQKSLADQIVGQEMSGELLKNFTIMARLYSSHDPSGSSICLFYSNPRSRSLAIEVLRSMMEICTNSDIYNVFLVSPTPMSNVNHQVIIAEYPKSFLEFWSIQDIKMDWFGCNTINPMAVCSTSKTCVHRDPVNLGEGPNEQCEKCEETRRAVVGAIPDADRAMTGLISSCMISRRFDMNEGDILDSARPNGRYLRQRVAD